MCSDEVDFALRTTPIAGDDGVTALLEVFSGEGFALFAKLIGRSGHYIMTLSYNGA
jgi:hypothetical protein